MRKGLDSEELMGATNGGVSFFVDMNYHSWQGYEL